MAAKAKSRKWSGGCGTLKSDEEKNAAACAERLVEEERLARGRQERFENKTERIRLENEKKERLAAVHLKVAKVMRIQNLEQKLEQLSNKDLFVSDGHMFRKGSSPEIDAAKKEKTRLLEAAKARKKDAANAAKDAIDKHDDIVEDFALELQKLFDIVAKKTKDGKNHRESKKLSKLLKEQVEKMSKKY
jgi:hypothetical protein